MEDSPKEMSVSHLKNHKRTGADPICHTRWDMLGGAGYRAKDRKQRYGWYKWILDGTGYGAMILSNDILSNDILAMIF